METKCRVIAVDTETTGTDLRHTCRPFIISTCTKDGVVKCWEWKVDPITRQPLIPSQERLEVAQYLSGATLVFHNAKFDLRALASIGIGIYFEQDGFHVYPYPEYTARCESILVRCHSFHDTLLASHACSSSDKHGLKELGVKYLRYSDSDERKLKEAVNAAARFCRSNDVEVNLGTSLTGERSTGSDYWLPKFVYEYILETEGEVPEEIQPWKDLCVTYAGKDVERTILLWGVFSEVMEQLKVREGYERERKLLQTVYRIETDGITVSKTKLRKKIKQLEGNRDEYFVKAQRFADRQAGKKVNIASGKQLIELLYKVLKLPILERTDKGVPKTDKPTLIRLLEIVQDKESKHYCKSTANFFRNLLCGRAYDSGIKYLRNYRAFGVHHPKRKDFIILYPSLNQSGTGTTRFSSSNPNGQNVSKIALIEIAGEELEGPRLRDVYGPPPDEVWYAIDYNQLELRVFAFASQEESLIQALDEGYDFHGYVSTRIFEKPIEQISKQERRIAKNTDFAIIFGAGPAKVNATAGIPNAYEMFSGLFPNVHSYMQQVIREVKKTGYVRTLDDYRLDVPSQHPYKAVNYLVQGTAGSIIKNAMIEIDRKGLVDWKDSRIVLQIHDELIIAFKKSSPAHTPRAVYNIMAEMEKAGAALGINTPVSCERIETDWGHGEEVEVTKTKIIPLKKVA